MWERPVPTHRSRGPIRFSGVTGIAGPCAVAEPTGAWLVRAGPWRDRDLRPVSRTGGRGHAPVNGTCGPLGGEQGARPDPRRPVGDPSSPGGLSLSASIGLVILPRCSRSRSSPEAPSASPPPVVSPTAFPPGSAAGALARTRSRWHSQRRARTRALPWSCGRTRTASSVAAPTPRRRSVRRRFARRPARSRSTTTGPAGLRWVPGTRSWAQRSASSTTFAPSVSTRPTRPRPRS